MSRLSKLNILVVLAVAALALCACGGSGPSGGNEAVAPATTSGSVSAPATAPQAHPQAVEPSAGAQATATATAPQSSDIVGDPKAHAPPLAVVKRELTALNLCGGTTIAADAAPLVKSSAPGFVADPGTQQTEGQLPEITAQLNALAKALGVTIYGISGYRSPAHSVAVGGFADDPHTKGEAEDIGVNSLLRSSAAQITEAELAKFGLYRPFDPSDDPNNTEVNHLQLIPHGGPLTLAQSTAAYDPDPSCQ
ncbi:MAG: D-Ala-D-Ala carboxypeptidase family metallohydrolase [Solirubrobacteraceae bacterium]